MPALSLAERLTGSPYQGYLYAYPHKTAYGPLAPTALDDVWAAEDRSALFLYLHVPFCGYRCGFCNLFTTSRSERSQVDAYLDTLTRQARAARRALGDARFVRLAVGGGTPTALEVDQLARLLDLASEVAGGPLDGLAPGVETSPDTATPERLRLLRERGVWRISMGVQSFVEEETRAAGRPVRSAQVDQALGALRAAEFPVLNLDLIYGLPGQTEASWARSLEAALRWQPEELFLYPLYVRPLTGLERRGLPAARDLRLALYRQGRARLLAAGYTQRSMRLFVGPHAPRLELPRYRCQADGMLGLGCGARSYTRALHYASDYAVGARGVREVLSAWIAQDDAALGSARHGYALDGDEQRRRWAIQSLLCSEGLEHAAYRARFASAPADDLPQLGELVELGLAEERDAGLHLTPAGLERSDAIGPWLISPRVAARMSACELV
ncbi:MAG: STM4012 family radical SAM protein [Planctomycetes bacterium]|nr:STM4012 family radical SAM protein [Planctomycetota bacterium]